MRAFLHVLLLAAAAAAQPYDVVIRNGHIIDGTGSPWYAADMGIREGRIASIGRLEGSAAKRTIDAHGMAVAPGFIDMLGQSELTILVNPHLPSKIYQGITTEVTGEGNSVAPSTTPSSRPIRSPMSITGLCPTGALSVSISRGCASRAWASTSPLTWELRRCDGWFWATTTARPRRPNWGA
jgi:N-acyl-D-aspartate/D-glutamate deacylase